MIAALAGEYPNFSRNADCLDGAEWNGYGTELSRARGMRCNMVYILWVVGKIGGRLIYL